MVGMTVPARKFIPCQKGLEDDDAVKSFRQKVANIGSVYWNVDVDTHAEILQKNYRKLLKLVSLLGGLSVVLSFLK
eukprot:7687845-Prorocentrum_lima.AAC.1